MKKVIFLLFAMSFLLPMNKVKASHLLGGEISWECLNSGKFVFKVTLYRACYQGAAGLGGSTALSNPLYAKYGGVSTISLTRTTATGLDLSEYILCPGPSFQINCGVPLGVGFATPIEKHVYKSNAIQINGTPDTSGSEFTWSSCCRPTSNNIHGTSSYYLRAVMFPFFDSQANKFLELGNSSTGPSCYDSSPEFVENPIVAYCGDQLNRINASTYDRDNDSLYYDWSAPLQSSTNSVVWKSWYYDSLQLPNINHANNNFGPFFDKQQGQIYFNTQAPLVSGFYQMSTKSISYRNGQKISEIFRDIPTQILNCQSSVPNVNTPAILVKEASDSVYQLNFHDTVQAGSTVHLKIKLEDFDTLQLNPLKAQSVKLKISGNAMSTLTNNQINCLYKPCAFIDSNNTSYISSTKEFKDTSNLEVDFYWNTSCENLNYFHPIYNSDSVKTYRFKIEAFDNFCPLPGRNTVYMFITIYDTNIVKPSIFETIDGQNKGTRLIWPKYVGSNFNSYELYYSESESQPWNHLTSILNRNTVSYTDLSILSDQKPIRYRIKVNNGTTCDSNFAFKNIHMDLGGTMFNPELTWNYPFDNNTNNNIKYTVLRSVNYSSWTTIAQRSFGNELFTEQFSFGVGSVIRYKITANDTNNISFISNIDSIYIDPAIWDGVEGFNIKNVLLFPIPVQNKLIVQFSSIERDMNFSIYSIDGSLVKRGSLNSMTNDIDLNSIQSGMYFIEIENQNGAKVQRKFIKD